MIEEQELRRIAEAAGLDPDDVFVRGALNTGWRPDLETPKRDDNWIRDLCPIETGVEYPGKQIPLPADHDRRPVADRHEYRIPTIYPFPDMAVGDSFKVDTSIAIWNVQSAAHYFAAKHGVMFSFRGRRCWRVW